MNPFRKNPTLHDLGKGAAKTRLSMSNNFVRTTCYALTVTLLSGCMTKRSNYDVPEIPLPVQYKNSPAKSSADSQRKPIDSAPKTETAHSLQDMGLVEWWRSFGNTELVQLIDRGLANNPDVRIATEQMAQAKTRVDQARAGMLPTITAPISISSGTISPGISSVSQRSYQASLQGSFRPDLWGERSSLAESAKFQLWQASFNRDNVQRNMVASLASSYVDYLSLNDRLRVARETDAVMSRMLTSVENRVAAGDATLIELDQQKATIFSIRATIPTLEQQREEALTTLAFLVGSVPGSLKLSSDGLDALFLPTVIPALPSSLLLRRPDIRMAEAKLLSSDADIDVARARLLPPLDLSGAVGHNSLSMSQFFSPSTLFWNSISNLTVTIFDAGKLKSDKENAQAIHEEMVENYARTIYQATREVESALASIRLTGSRLSSQKEATASARLAWDTSAKVFALGGLDYQTLLDSEHNYHSYLTQYLQIKTDSFHGYISLFQALGGGVNFVKPIPGKGDRPTSILTTASNSIIQKAATPFSDAPQKDVPSEGVDWVGNITSKFGGTMQVENFWQVELPGLYHQSTIGATWRDLKTRYPKLMEYRTVRPRLDGTIENSPDGQLALYRLYVSKFESPEAAHEMCFALKANFQRCRVVSSRSDDEVPEPAVSKQNTEPVPASAAPKIAEQKTIEPVLVSEVTKPVLQNINDLSNPVGFKTISASADVVSEHVNKQSEKQVYTVQLDAFTDPANAANSEQFWKARKYNVYVSENRNSAGEIRYGVRTGIFQSKRDAITLAQIFKRKEDQPAAVVKTSLDNSGNPVSIDINKLRSLASTVPPPNSTKILAVPRAETSITTAKEKTIFTVQLGIFTTEGNALKSLEKWKNHGLTAYITELKNDDNSSRFVIRTGRFTDMQEASEVMHSLRRTEGIRATLVTVDVAKADAPVEIKQSFSGEVSVTDIPKTAKSSNNG